MKKIICTILVLIFILTGCSQPAQVTQINTKPIPGATTITEENITNKEIINYSKDDKIIQALKKNNYTINENFSYSMYPNNEYFFPEYIEIDGELKTIYLNKTVKEKIYQPTIEITPSTSQTYPTLPGCIEGDKIITKAVTEQYGQDSYKCVQDGTCYSATVLIPNGTAHVCLKSRPAVDDFKVQMMEDGSLDIYGIGASESKSSSLDFPDFSELADVFIDKINIGENKKFNESNFLSVKNNPLSTFAADVDTASYTNLRNIIRKSSEEYSLFNRIDINDLEEVRIEEMLNYFDYNFKNEIDEPFAIQAEIAKTPWNKDTQLLVVNIASKELPEEKKEGSNLVFLIDTSGSMDYDDKLPLVKESLKLLVNELTEQDTISIVTYSGSESVIIDGTTGDRKEEILSAINRLKPYGSTNGEGGLKAAYTIAEKYKDKHSNSRIIMCSDGDLNVGISSERELQRFIEKKRDTGIYLSILGFGNGNYKDSKMEILADKGNGNYFYIDSVKEGYKVLVEDLMSTLVTIADDVKFQIEFNPEYVKGYRKIGYENRDMADGDFHDDTKDGGEIGYGHSVTIVYEIVPIDSLMEIESSNFKYQNKIKNNNSTDWMTISIRYKDHGEKTSKLLQGRIDSDNYTSSPSNNWKFAANVVGFGLIVNNSQHKEDLTIDQIIDSLNNLNLNDNDKIEFLSIVLGYKYHNYYR